MRVATSVLFPCGFPVVSEDIPVYSKSVDGWWSKRTLEMFYLRFLTAAVAGARARFDGRIGGVQNTTLLFGRIVAYSTRYLR